MAKVKLCGFESETLEAFLAASHFYAKFDCPLAARIVFFYFYLLRMIVKLAYTIFRAREQHTLGIPPMMRPATLVWSGWNDIDRKYHTKRKRKKKKKKTEIMPF